MNKIVCSAIQPKNTRVTYRDTPDTEAWLLITDGCPAEMPKSRRFRTTSPITETPEFCLVLFRPGTTRNSIETPNFGDSGVSRQNAETETSSLARRKRGP